MIAANERWEIEAVDVTSAFLQGAELDRDVLVRPPKEAGVNGVLWKMKKAAYGLTDASRRWWIRVIEELLKLGGKTMVGDESMVYFHFHGKLSGIVSIHTDDFQMAGTAEFKEKVADKIVGLFKISKRETKTFKYTGVDVCQEENGDIVIRQTQYKDSLEEIPVHKD